MIEKYGTFALYKSNTPQKTIATAFFRRNDCYSTLHSIATQAVFLQSPAKENRRPVLYDISTVVI